MLSLDEQDDNTTPKVQHNGVEVQHNGVEVQHSGSEVQHKQRLEKIATPIAGSKRAPKTKISSKTKELNYGKQQSIHRNGERQ